MSLISIFFLEIIKKYSFLVSRIFFNSSKLSNLIGSKLVIFECSFKIENRADMLNINNSDLFMLK